MQKKPHTKAKVAERYYISGLVPQSFSAVEIHLRGVRVVLVAFLVIRMSASSQQGIGLAFPEWIVRLWQKALSPHLDYRADSAT